MNLDGLERLSVLRIVDRPSYHSILAPRIQSNTRNSRHGTHALVCISARLSPFHLAGCNGKGPVKSQENQRVSFSLPWLHSASVKRTLSQDGGPVQKQSILLPRRRARPALLDPSPGLRLQQATSASAQGFKFCAVVANQHIA